MRERLSSVTPPPAQLVGIWLLAPASCLLAACGGNSHTVADQVDLAGAEVVPAEDTSDQRASGPPGIAAPVDSSIAIDSLAGGPDILAVVEQSPADLAALLDSLRTQVAALESQVTRLRTVGAADQLSPPLENNRTREQDQPEGLDAARRAQETAQDVRHFGFRAIWATILFLFAWLAIKGSVWILDVLSERSAKRRLLFKKLIPIVRLMVWALTVFYVVSAVFEVDRAGLLAGTAALGVGIGFAAQGVLKNVFGGLIIIFDQPFQVGDKINVGGTYGEVVSIGMRATRIVTPDDNLVSVPNAQIIEGQVANANAGELDCQVVVDLYVPGWVDVVKAKSIALNAALNSQYTYLNKPVVVNVKDEFDRIFLTHLVVKAYVIDTRYEFALASDITQAAKEQFLQHGMVPVMPIERQMAEFDPSGQTRGSENV